MRCVAASVDMQNASDAVAGHEGAPTNDSSGGGGSAEEAAALSIDLGAALYIAGMCTSAVSIVLTSVVAYLLSRTSGGRRPYLSLILNLSVSDLLISVATIGILGSDYVQMSIEAGAYGEVPVLQRRNACLRFLVGQVWDVATYENLATLWLMAADHFIAIRFPLRYVVVMKKAYLRAIICSTWVACAVLGSLPVIFVANSYDPIMDSWPAKGTTRFCYQYVVYSHRELFQLSQDSHSQTVRMLAAAMVTVVFTSIVVTYAYILAVVLKMRRDYSLVLAGKAASNSKMSALAEKKKAILTTLSLVSCFCVCYVPIEVYYILQDGDLSRGGSPNYAIICFTSLVSCVGIFDPLIYTARTPEVKSAVREIMACSRKELSENPVPHSGLRRGTVSTMV